MNKSKSAILFTTLVLLVGAILHYGKLNDKPREKFYSGVVEATQYDLSFEVSGTLESIRVKEGEAVKRGQLLATLEREKMRQKVKASEARLGQGQARLNSLLNGSRQEDILAVQARLKEAGADLERLNRGATEEELATRFHRKQAAQEMLNLRRNGYRNEDIQQAKARLRRSKVELQTAKSDYRRYQELLDEGAAPEAVIDEKRLRYESAQAHVSELSEALGELRAGYRREEKAMALEEFQTAKAQYEELAVGTRPELIQAAQARFERLQAEALKIQRGPRVEDIEAARQHVASLSAELSRLKQELRDMKIYSPYNGVITNKTFQPRETILAGTPLLQLSAVEETWVNIFIPQSDLAKIQLGHACEVSIDSYPNRTFEGTVRYISPSAEFTPRFVQTERERVLLVYRAEVLLNDSQTPLRSGMPADVQVVSP